MAKKRRRGRRIERVHLHLPGKDDGGCGASAAAAAAAAAAAWTRKGGAGRSWTQTYICSIGNMCTYYSVESKICLRSPDGDLSPDRPPPPPAAPPVSRVGRGGGGGRRSQPAGERAANARLALVEGKEDEKKIIFFSLFLEIETGKGGENGRGRRRRRKDNLDHLCKELELGTRDGGAGREGIGLHYEPTTFLAPCVTIISCRKSNKSVLVAMKSFSYFLSCLRSLE